MRRGIAELAALHLAEKVLGQVAYYFDLARAFLMGQVQSTMLIQGAQVEFAVAGHDHGLDDLAAVRIRLADYGRVGNVRERRQHFFYLGGKDEEARSLDDVLFSVHDREETLGITTG